METSINILGYKFFEPVTFLTNIFLALVSLFFATKLVLLKTKHSKTKSISFFLFFYGFATLIAGFGHLFFKDNQNFLSFSSWILASIAIFHLEKYCLFKIKNDALNKIIKSITILKLGIVIICILIIKDFIIVIINSSFSIISFILSVAIYSYIKEHYKSDLYFILFVFAGFFSAFIFTQKIFINKWFNHKDFSHIFLILSTIFIYLAAKKIEDEKEEEVTEGEEVLLNQNL